MKSGKIAWRRMLYPYHSPYTGNKKLYANRRSNLLYFFIFFCLLLFESGTFGITGMRSYAWAAGVMSFAFFVGMLVSLAKANMHKEHFCEKCGEDFKYNEPVIEAWETPDGNREFSYHPECAHTLGFIPLETVLLTEKRRKK